MCSTNYPPTVLKCMPLLFGLVATGARFWVLCSSGELSAEFASEPECEELLASVALLPHWSYHPHWMQVQA